MKTRAEMLRERNAAKDTKSSKPSAAERTLPIPEVSFIPVEVRCQACGEVSKTEGITRREDGALECPECAAPILVDQNAKDSQKPTSTEEKPKADPPKEKTNGVHTKTGNFCGDCGAEWPVADGKTIMSCGHTKALRVDDPRKAKDMQPVTSSGMTKPPPEPPSIHTGPTPHPTVTVQGNRMSIGWGKTSFPVGEAAGFKFSNMEVPTQIITVELAPGDDRVKAAREIFADLQKIADMAFDTQFDWYKKKLKLM